MSASNAAAAAVPRHPAATLQRALWRIYLTLRYRILQRHRYDKLVLERIDGMPLVVLPRVFNPKLLRSGAVLVQYLTASGRLAAAQRVLDLGCGSGASAVAAARAGCQVVASDINPAAVRCTRVNILLNDVEHRVDVRHGDLFEPVGNERFDLILFNPPYYRGRPRDALDHAWRSPDVMERFAAQLADHLTPDGRALLILSSDGDPDAYLRALERSGFNATSVARRDFHNEEMRIYSVTPRESAC